MPTSPSNSTASLQSDSLHGAHSTTRHRWPSPDRPAAHSSPSQSTPHGESVIRNRRDPHPGQPECRTVGCSRQLVVTIEVHTDNSNPAPVLRHTKRRTGSFRFVEDTDWPGRVRPRCFPAESGLIQPFPAFHFSVLHFSVPSPVSQRKRQTERCRTERWEQRDSRHSPQQRPRKQGRVATG